VSRLNIIFKGQSEKRAAEILHTTWSRFCPVFSMEACLLFPIFAEPKQREQLVEVAQVEYNPEKRNIIIIFCARIVVKSLTTVSS